jgi:hypothetical protein
MDRSATACLVLTFVVSCSSIAVATVDQCSFVDVDGRGADVFASNLRFHPAKEEKELG